MIRLVDGDHIADSKNYETGLTQMVFLYRSSVEEVDEREIFEGSENRLTLNQTYTHKFQCLYMLEKYPFDKQECLIIMTTAGLDKTVMELFPKKLLMEQVPDMTLYNMVEWTLTYRNEKAP